MSEQKSGGFFNGFILGLLVGAGLVFLFGTSKGKRVLQMLLEQVEENTELSELLEMPEDEEVYDEMEEEAHEEKSEEPMKMEETVHREEEKPKVSAVKRFFKGSKKIIS